MDSELKQKWIEALRSGKYEQTQGQLRDTNEGSYCCLGVLCVVAGVDLEVIENDPDQTGDYKPLQKLVQGSDVVDYVDMLIELNDTKRASFPKIADWIEANL